MHNRLWMGYMIECLAGPSVSLTSFENPLGLVGVIRGAHRPELKLAH
jgi:hypothetical protein